MTRAWARSVTRITLGLLLAVAALYVVTGGKIIETAVVLAWVTVEPLFANTHAPAIADGLFTSWDWRHWGDDDRRFAAILEEKFPIGTSEAQLKSTLLGQGFKPSPPEECLPEGQPAPVRKTIRRCPSHDQSKELTYRWSRFPCGQTIMVWWAAGDSGETSQIKGIHFGGCL